MDNTPAYLVRLRPVLKVNGERMVVGKDGLPMGANYSLTLELISPSGVEKITSTHTAGNLAVIGIVSQKAISGQLSAIGEEDDAETILYKEANRYIDRWNQAEEELAALMKLTLTRPAPTVVTLGGVIDVTYLLDTPHGFEWKGVSIDANLRVIETVGAYGNTPVKPSGQEEGQKTFMQLSTLQGSILENRIFEDDFQVESISTAKLFGLARNTQPATEILTIDRSNITSILSTLPFDENIKEDIQNAVNQDFVVRIPQSEVTHEDWTGIGYIKENPDTGEAGYMLSGMIAGGMTAWGMDRWPGILGAKLQSPYSEPPNFDPASATYIKKIPATDLQKGIVGTRLPQPLQVEVRDKKNRPVPGVEVTFSVKAGGGKLSLGSTSFKIRTGDNGVASAYFFAGLKTSDNPTYIWEPGYTYGQRVGENIIDASLPSGTRIPIPFTAYGFPKEPSQIKKIHGGGWGSILTFAGFVSVVIEDEHGNPISNLPVVFQSGDAIVIQGEPPCENPNRDTRQAYLFGASEPCLKNAPVYGECVDPKTNRTIEKKTSSKGAAVEVILGGVPGARYPIRATSGNLSTDFNFYTFPFGNCSGTSDPSLQLDLAYVYPTDSYGHNIDAGKVGTEIPVMARIYFLKEKETRGEFTFDCGGNKISCDKVIGSGEYDIAKAKTAAVSFGGSAGSSADGGIFRGNYILKPGKNVINIDANASIELERTIICPSCITSTQVLAQSKSAAVEVYGVDIQVASIPVIPVDENGYATKDPVISYTINPPEYQALTAFVLISKDGDPIASIPTELIGKGSATISRGFWFDVNSTYEVEVVLNSGTGVEIRSEKLKLPIAGIRVVDDNGKDADEARFGDGSNPEKRYRIELVSKVLTEACSDLFGKIRVVDKNGVKIEVPGNKDIQEYYLSEYDLDFSSSGGQCTVKITDATAGGVIKDKIILSNLSKSALGERLLDQPSVDLTKMAVLYPGLGNSLEIEINGAKRGVDIEPVGVILIGIDGLRQDVLYPEGKDDVKEAGKYRVEIGQLAGLKQILLGYNQPEEKQSYIMLPKVTAIFPSLTYASWASIFTGKLPNETGITGNEFFARDLYGSGSNPIPGMAGISAGMVSLDEGAFSSGGTKFVLQNAIPAEFSLFGYAAGTKTLTAKIQNSAPLAAIQTAPFFEEIGKTVGNKYSISSNRDIRCDQSQYECRTVAMFSHYAKGADWWGTPSLSWANVFDYSKSLFDTPKIMDEAPANEAVSFIENYFSKSTLEGKRKRFPAFFSIYFSGIDHYAHQNGMEGYSGFFQQTTDPQIGDFVKALKDQGEFDNKIFIIVSDHGMTAMPTNLTFKIKQKLFDADGKEYTILDERLSEMSCELKLDFKDPKDPDQVNIAKEAELNNNNLHIWELAEVLRMAGEANEDNPDKLIKVLAPKETAELYVKRDETNKMTKMAYGATDSAEDADLIAGLNGPMAHLYSKDLTKIGERAELLRIILKEEDFASAMRWFNLGRVKYAKIRDQIARLNSSVDKIFVRMDGNYFLFRGLDSSGNVIPDIIATLDQSKYIDSATRLDGMNHPKRSGDIVILMKDDVDIPSGGKIEDFRYTAGVSCKSWHGSLNRTDSYVPLVVAYPGGNRDVTERLLKADDLCADSYGSCKGNWKVPNIIKKIIAEQYR